MLLLRALLAVLLLPGVLAFAVPLLVLRPGACGRPFAAPGAPLVGAGVALLVWCVGEFLVRGRGTLAPWDPPQTLVREGPYRFSRNPMYVGVLLIVLGWAVGFRSPAIGAYAGGLAVAFHLRVVLGEEPWLAGRYGAAWESYRNQVPRWLR